IEESTRRALAEAARMPAPDSEAERQAKNLVETQISALSETLAPIIGDVSFIRVGMAKLADLRARPLTLPEKSAPTRTPVTPDDRYGFVFRRERLAMVGRDNELAALSDWLAAEPPFSWDLWTGHAGAGKSRLALQLCRNHPGRHSGFYDWAVDAHVRFDY